MSSIPEKAQWPGWETVRLIGRGSFGGVYEIQRKIFDETETAALKVISVPQSSGDIDELYSVGYDEESITEAFKDQLKGIVNEYSLMRKLNGCHNIVSCDDVRYVQQDNGYGWDIYIKMELLTPLLKALPARIPEQTVIQMAKDLCSALDWCKRYNIIHRDIKPQNIFVSEAGEYKLGDFGIAKTVEKTSGGTRIGTYKYIAPEVFFSKPYGSAADIYSLGLTLYWMLNERRMPFLPLPPTKLTVGMEEEARQRRLSGQPLPDPWNGSEKLKAIVLKACAYKPEDRYQSAREMLEDLEALDAPASRPMAYAPAEATEADTEGTALLDGAGQTALLFPEEEQTGLLTREEEPQEKPYGFVEGTVLMEEDDTLLMPREEEPKTEAPAPEVPNPEAEKQPLQTTAAQTDKPKGKWAVKTVFVLCGILMLYVVLVIFHTHTWSPATCESSRRCSTCGETRGEPLGHTWQAESRHHPATCTVCGKTSREPIQPILAIDSIEVQGKEGVESSCSGETVKITSEMWTDLTNANIAIVDCTNGNDVTDSFNIGRYGYSVAITAKPDTDYGVYKADLNCKDGKLSITLVCGIGREVYHIRNEEFADLGCGLMSLVNREYLIKTGEAFNGLETTPAKDRKTVFASTSDICGVAPDIYGNLYPCFDREMVSFEIKYCHILGDGGCFAFAYQDWYLACDETGRVYLTTELTKDCCWLLIS